MESGRDLGFIPSMYLTINGFCMYIIDKESKKKVDDIVLILTKSEMKQLLGYARQLLETPPPSDHYHLSDEDYKKEITICLRELDGISKFDPEIEQLIQKDE